MELAPLMTNVKLTGTGNLRCAVASVKGNVGHSLAAAGMAVLIGSVRVLNHKVIPPQAGLQATREGLGLNGSGFYIPTAAQPFAARNNQPRRAGVNAFGFGGTNVHVILEEPPQIAKPMRATSNGHEDRFSSRPFWVIEHKEKSNGHSAAPNLSVNSAPPAANGELKGLFEQQLAMLKQQMELIQSQVKLLGLSEGQPSASATLVQNLTTESTRNGDRARNISAEPVVAQPEITYAPSHDSIRQSVIEIIARVSAFSIDDLEPEKRLGADLGFDSLVGADLFVALTEAFPQTRTLPESLLGGNTTIEELVHAVGAAVANKSVEPAADKIGVAEIRRYVGAAKDSTLPTRSQEAKLPFEGTVLLVADSRGVAKELARLLRDARREVKIVSANEALAVDAESALIDLTGLDAPDPSANTSEFSSTIIATLARATAVAAKAPPQAFVVAHRGITSAGLAGIAKSVAREYPQAIVKSLQFENDASAEALAEKIFAEMISNDETVEVRYAAGVRQTLALQQESIEAARLRDGVVVAIAGGGPGRGAKLAIERARRHKACLILLGRAAEADATIKSVRDAGGRAVYVSCDVRDRAQVESAFEQGREAFGPIECVVHAAGDLSDQSLASKDVQQAAPVIDTKIAGALALWEATRPDPLASFVMYGSWAGRFGSPHQSDYSAANHVLGRLAAHLGSERAGTRVTTIDLPPWQDSGMVSRLTESARRALQTPVTFLPDKVGLDYVIAEMAARGPSGEIVLGAGLEDESADAVTFEISTARYPWLNDHRINGQVIIPFALALDHCADAARRL